MATEVVQTPTIKPRRPWLAAVLNLLFFPIGHAYAGSFRRMLLFFLGWLLLLIAMASVLIGLSVGWRGLWAMVALLLVFRVVASIDAYFLARHNCHALRKWFQRWWIYVFVYIVTVGIYNVLSTISRQYVAETFVIPTRAMHPAIDPGDRIIVDKWNFDPTKIQRDDVVVFYSKGQDSPLYVKRVLGLPGETIEIIDEMVYINGKEYVDRFAHREGSIPEFVPEIARFGPKTVPKDSCFVLGDNRRSAVDSRFLGPVPLADVIGKARMIYWSSERIPDPEDPERFTTGAIRWSRMGMRLD